MPLRGAQRGLDLPGPGTGAALPATAAQRRAEHARLPALIRHQLSEAADTFAQVMKTAS